MGVQMVLRDCRSLGRLDHLAEDERLHCGSLMFVGLPFVRLTILQESHRYQDCLDLWAVESGCGRRLVRVAVSERLVYTLCVEATYRHSWRLLQQAGHESLDRRESVDQI